MRIEPELTYKDYEDRVIGAFHLLGDPGCEKAENITNYMTDEDDELLIDGSTDLAIWIITIAVYEVTHDILEDRVLEQLSYHIQMYEKKGAYKADLSEEEIEMMERDIDIIKSKVEFIPVVLD